MPSALAITRSSGVVMKPRTRSAFAPMYVVVTLTTAISLRGYCRTLRERMDCRPAIRITRLTTIASTGLLTKISVNFIGLSLAVLGFGSRTISRLNLVVDLNSGAVAEFEDAGRHHLVAGLYSRNRHLVTARAFHLHKLLAHPEICVSLWILHLRNDENGVAVGCIADRRCGQGDHGTCRAHGEVRFDEHPGSQLTVSIGNRRLDLHVSRLLIQD